MLKKLLSSIKNKNLSRIFFLVTLLVFTAPSHAWEAYSFDVSSIKTIASSTDICEIGMKNLSSKSSNDSSICDNPVAIRISNCSSELSQTMMALAMIAKTSRTRMFHQAVAEHSSSPCIVKPYNLTLSDEQ